MVNELKQEIKELLSRMKRKELFNVDVDEDSVDIGFWHDNRRREITIDILGKTRYQLLSEIEFKINLIN